METVFRSENKTRQRKIPVLEKKIKGGSSEKNTRSGVIVEKELLGTQKKNADREEREEEVKRVERNNGYEDRKYNRKGTGRSHT